MPHVTVIIPAYNRPEYLAEAVESVFAQSFKDWELLIVDDGCSEEIASLGRRVCARDARVRYIRQAHQGVSVARNRAIREAQGELIAFLDDDDRWLPGYLKAQTMFLREHPEHGWAFTDAYQIDDLGRWTGDTVPHACRASIAHLLSWQSAWMPSQTVIRRSCLRGPTGAFDRRMPIAQDRDLWIRLLRRYSLGRVPGVHAEYRKHRGGASKRIEWKMRDYIAILKKLRRDPPPGISAAWVHQEAGRLHYQLAWRYLDQGLHRAAARQFMGAVASCPTIGLCMRRPAPRSAAYRFLAPYGAIGYSLALVVWPAKRWTFS